MRVVFFGTPDFAVPSLDALLSSRHAVVGVVTQPDRPKGRGHKTSAPPVKAHALGAGLPVLQPERLKDEAWLAAFRALGADVAVVAAYGKLLPQVLLDLPPRGFLNVHASLLPRYRGAAPIQRAVINGERETGVTIMRVVLALDAGPMLARVVRPIGPEETSEDVERDLATLGARLLVDTLDALEERPLVETPQDERDATYAPRLAKEEGRIDWTMTASVLRNRVRGLRPWPQASTFLGDRRLVVWRAAVAEAAPEAHAAAGTLLEASGGRLVVATGEGTALELVEVQLEGRRAMTAREFLAGHRLAPGTPLGAGSS